MYGLGEIVGIKKKKKSSCSNITVVVLGTQFLIGARGFFYVLNPGTSLDVLEQELSLVLKLAKPGGMQFT